MKITKLDLKKIIAEEIKKTLEGLSRMRNYTFIDLYEFAQLVQDGSGTAQVSGIDVSSGTKIPVSMTLSVAEGEAAEALENSGKGVPVPDELLGTPFYVLQLGPEYVFVLDR